MSINARKTGKRFLDNKDKRYERMICDEEIRIKMASDLLERLVEKHPFLNNKLARKLYGIFLSQSLSFEAVDRNLTTLSEAMSIHTDDEKQVNDIVVANADILYISSNELKSQLMVLYHFGLDKDVLFGDSMFLTKKYRAEDIYSVAKAIQEEGYEFTHDNISEFLRKKQEEVSKVKTIYPLTDAKRFSIRFIYDKEIRKIQKQKELAR